MLEPSASDKIDLKMRELQKTKFQNKIDLAVHSIKNIDTNLSLDHHHKMASAFIIRHFSHSIRSLKALGHCY